MRHSPQTAPPQAGAKFNARQSNATRPQRHTAIACPCSGLIRTLRTDSVSQVVAPGQGPSTTHAPSQ